MELTRAAPQETRCETWLIRGENFQHIAEFWESGVEDSTVTWPQATDADDFNGIGIGVWTYRSPRVRFRFDNVRVEYRAASPTNHAPVIEHGPTVSPSPVDIGVPASLSVAASDVDDDPLWYRWRVSSGPATVVFAPNDSESASNTLATFPLIGVYTTCVVASDWDMSATGTVAVTAVPEACGTAAAGCALAVAAVVRVRGSGLRKGPAP
jgi:hypothetical protein